MTDVVLDAYAARSCPVKTYNLFNRAIPRPESPDESLGEAFHGGRVFEQQILDALVALHPDATDLRGLRAAGADWAAREQACREAMARGDALIVDGVLPIDAAGHRSGRPDLLVRGDDAAHGRPGYHPVEVKLQKVLERRPGATGQLASGLDRPLLSEASELRGVGFRASKERTLLQLAHYWRLLDATGHASAGEPIVGVIGQDQPSGDYVITWANLADKIIRTFSRTSAQGWKLRSALERYDHEHQFRVYVATQAAVSAPAPVVPIVVRECDNCVWWQHCRTQLHDEAITLRINKSPLDVREISALSSLGVSTLTDLASVDVDELLPRYLPEVRHREGAEPRIRLAARRARLLMAGIELERTTSGPLDLPPSDLEIDFDIETADDGRTYLWGLLLTDRAADTVTYRAFARFDDMDDADEIALLVEFARFLTDAMRGRDALVYHYSDYEKVFLTRLAQFTDDPAVAELVGLLGDRFVDLFGVVKAHFFGTNGLGLKMVATAGAGFEWRDDDPGGLNSQTWFHDAVHADSEDERRAARVRVLEYNEDDVRATKALRDWLRSLS